LKRRELNHFFAVRVYGWDDGRLGCDLSGRGAAECEADGENGKEGAGFR